MNSTILQHIHAYPKVERKWNRLSLELRREVLPQIPEKPTEKELLKAINKVRKEWAT